MQRFSSNTSVAAFPFPVKTTLETLNQAAKWKLWCSLYEISVGSMSPSPAWWHQEPFSSCHLILEAPVFCKCLLTWNRLEWSVLQWCAKTEALLGLLFGQTQHSPDGPYVVLQAPRCSLIPGLSLHADQLWVGVGSFLQCCCFFVRRHTKSQQLVNNYFRVFFSAGAEYISAFSCTALGGKWLLLVITYPPSTTLAAMLSTSNSSTSQADIIRNPKVNNLIIYSAQRLLCRRSDSRKSAAQIHTGKMPDFKKETGRDLEERLLPHPSLVIYFGPSALQ